MQDQAVEGVEHSDMATNLGRLHSGPLEPSRQSERAERAVPLELIILPPLQLKA